MAKILYEHQPNHSGGVTLAGNRALREPRRKGKKMRTKSKKKRARTAREPDIGTVMRFNAIEKLDLARREMEGAVELAKTISKMTMNHWAQRRRKKILEENRVVCVLIEDMDFLGAELLSSEGPDPDDLIGRAKFIFRMCYDAGLQPSIVWLPKIFKAKDTAKNYAIYLLGL